ncbi:hypothetical protein GCM10023091_34580 [Ravibacter arvi]|uniref:Uncharacterized protein n=1 Tax=Ravibacter arvi TaxID=2051041 RepID=A0ABP8M812_9BACT
MVEGSELRIIYLVLFVGQIYIYCLIYKLFIELFKCFGDIAADESKRANFEICSIKSYEEK